MARALGVRGLPDRGLAGLSLPPSRLVVGAPRNESDRRWNSTSAGRAAIEYSLRCAAELVGAETRKLPIRNVDDCEIGRVQRSGWTMG